MIKSRKKLFNQMLFKIIAIGDSATGKSCLMLRYIKDDFNPQYSVTVGVQFASKIIKIDQTYSIKLQIWDTAGQQSFRSIVRNFYRNASAVFLVYSVIKKSSFQSLSEWLKQARQNSPKNSMYVLVGTHMDCLQEGIQRQVSREQGEKFMYENNLNLFFETSSKTNINVSNAFEQTGNQLFLNYIRIRGNSMMGEMKKESRLLMSESNKKQKNCC